MALSQDRTTLQRLNNRRNCDPVAANAICFVGAIVALNAAGFAVPGSATAANVTRGVNTADRADNTGGADGDINVETERGIFCFANSASADLITRLQIGSNCYVVDDQTVAKTSSSGARPVAGVIRDVDVNGVWVEF